MPNLTSHRPTASIIIIGNELLSGSIADLNTPYIAKGLVKHGIDLKEVRFIRDDETEIINTVNALRNIHDYVFTTGGIGPTHDDITSASIAKACNTELVRHDAIYTKLNNFFEERGKEMTSASARMAHIPQGAKLIENPISVAPGFILHNIHVMAGIPAVMQAMFDQLLPTLAGSTPISSRTVTMHVVEGDIADELMHIQKDLPDVEIGSYPIKHEDRFCVSVVLRSTDTKQLNIAEERIKHLAISRGLSTFELPSLK